MTIEQLNVRELAFEKKSTSSVPGSAGSDQKSVPIVINGTVKYLPENFFEPINNKPVSKFTNQLPIYGSIDDPYDDNRFESQTKVVKRSKSKDSHSHHHGSFEIWQLVAMVALFCIVVSSMIWLIRFDSSKCTMDEQTLEQCARRLFFFSADVERFPSTNHQLDLYCSDKGQSIKCLRRYVNSCLDVDKAQWRYFKKFVKNYQRQLDKTCLRVIEREKFITYSNCLSKSDLIQNATTCMDAHLDQLLYIAQMVPEKNRMATSCCALHLRHRCLTENISTRCQSEVERFVMEQIEGPFRSIVSSICSPYYMSLKGCRRRIKPHVWTEVFERPEFMKNFRETRQLLGGPNGTELLTENFHLDPNVNLVELDESNNDSNNQTAGGQQQQFVALSTDQHQNTQQLHTKLVQLKFQESILAMIFILRNKS